jgi:hypothetical protein
MFHIEGLIKGEHRYIGGNDGYPCMLEVSGNKYSGATDLLKESADKTTGMMGLHPAITDTDYLDEECAAYSIACNLFDKILVNENNYFVEGVIY